MPVSDVSLSLNGPLLTGQGAAAVTAGLHEGLTDVALHGQRLVQEQLYPGHGVVTGHLRRSIAGSVIAPAMAQIDAGLHQQGANLHYADAVEAGTGPHVITPKRARVLRFTSRGAVVFTRRVNHPGTKGLQMFQNAARQLEGGLAARLVLGPILRRLNGGN